MTILCLYYSEFYQYIRFSKVKVNDILLFIMNTARNSDASKINLACNSAVTIFNLYLPHAIRLCHYLYINNFAHVGILLTSKTNNILVFPEIKMCCWLR